MVGGGGGGIENLTVSPRTFARSAAALLVASALVLACASSAQYAEERRAGMLAEYPPGTTTRADVDARWSSKPELTETRGDSGWAGRPSAAARHALASERRTGRPIARVERHSGPDPGGSSIVSLRHGWFYYDAADRIVDVEWEYMSD